VHSVASHVAECACAFQWNCSNSDTSTHSVTLHVLNIDDAGDKQTLSLHMCPSSFTLGHMSLDKSLHMSSDLRPSVETLLVTCTDHTNGPIFDDIYIIQRVSMQGCAFWGLRWYCSIFMGSNRQKPNFGGVNSHFPAKHAKYWNSYYKNYWMYSNQILTDDKDLQVLLVCDLKIRYTNPRWRMAAILKKMEKWPYLYNLLTDVD